MIDSYLVDISQPTWTGNRLSKGKILVTYLQDLVLMAQQVKTVDHPALVHMKGVIVVNAHNHPGYEQSLLSLLSGGDFDGGEFKFIVTGVFS
jgi:hypothetical protein